MRVSTTLLQVALDVFSLLLTLLEKEVSKRAEAASALQLDYTDTLSPIVRSLAALRDDLTQHL